jgi:hypothetical protein
MGRNSVKRTKKSEEFNPLKGGELFPAMNGEMNAEGA